ncbi:SWI/SNF complex subunit SWI3D [Camellia lanceoleosa]|uniref:SWI/SNF complex subunit SWI3D n=1 Tax=Camellia lanceoleosa TaxID=1840588 RepID=A0ACC0H8T8_9ERIC|nr:SWI/SNF complex subunit SWI3D [Camellia lanceoleosa]
MNASAMCRTMKGILSADSVLVAQADYDLCTECFHNGKLDSGWSPTDFILMEPAGVSGGKWADLETLLLLEALELYNENWNEVAKHVATKTKAQCILHFVQMPIEDAFMDCDDEKNASVKENVDTAMADNDSSAPKKTPEIPESRTGTDENQPQSFPMEIPKPEDASELKADQKSTSVFQNHFQNIRTILEHADPFQNITASFTTCRSISEPVSSVAYQFQHQN